MRGKVKIKVVKKHEVNIHKTPEVKKEGSRKEATRQIVSTVSDWVIDFQRRRGETKQTFDYLFAQHWETGDLYFRFPLK